MIIKIPFHKLKTFVSFMIFIGLVFGTYFAVTRAYTPGDTSGVKKVMPPPYSDPSLVGYWGMDDNVASTTVVDSSGSGNNGTAQANTNTKSTTDAIHNRALTFNGTSDYVDLGSTIDDSFVQGDPVSVSAWVKYDSNPGDSNEIISIGFGSNAGFSLTSSYGNDNMPGFAYHNGITLSWALQAGGVSLYDGQWHFLVATASTWNNTANFKIYIDGVSKSFNGGGQAYVNTNSIGKGSYGKFNGSIDDVRIYNRALSAGEVKVLYMRGR